MKKLLLGLVAMSFIALCAGCGDGKNEPTKPAGGVPATAPVPLPPIGANPASK